MAPPTPGYAHGGVLVIGGTAVAATLTIAIKTLPTSSLRLFRWPHNSPPGKTPWSP